MIEYDSLSKDENIITSALFSIMKDIKAVDIFFGNGTRSDIYFYDFDAVVKATLYQLGAKLRELRVTNKEFDLIIKRNIDSYRLTKGVYTNRFR